MSGANIVGAESQLRSGWKESAHAEFRFKTLRASGESCGDQSACHVRRDEAFGKEEKSRAPRQCTAPLTVHLTGNPLIAERFVN